jgi:hypothetical protein
MLGPLRSTLGMPLCGSSSVFDVSASGCSIADKLARNRGRASTYPLGDLSYTELLYPKQSDFFTLCK